jgi:hypothetical protein
MFVSLSQCPGKIENDSIFNPPPRKASLKPARRESLGENGVPLAPETCILPEMTTNTGKG